MHREEPLLFDCREESLLGILALPEKTSSSIGVIILVGGPQYRIGSHRQFVLLARHLADNGITALRFDFRGMGDSVGDSRDFEAVGDDIAAAIDALFRACPNLQRVVLWGLCDAASAALLYWQERRDPRLTGLALLNPWVRSESGLARTQIRHYYRDRLLQGEFWRKLFSGRLYLRQSLGEALGKLRHLASGNRGDAAPDTAFQSRMLAALHEFPGALLVILSGNDYTAREFSDWADDHWRDRQNRPRLVYRQIDAADHTFSDADQRQQMEDATRHWLQDIAENP